MSDRHDRLTSAVSTLEADGYLIDASTRRPNQRYVTRFDVSDPIVSLVTTGGVFQLYWGVDYETARSLGFADAVYHARDFGYTGYGDPAAENRVVREFVRRHDVETVAVPDRFPVATAYALEPGISVSVPDDDPITALRASKSASEIDSVREATEAADAAIGSVASLLDDATVTDGIVTYEGTPVTGADLRRRVRDAASRTGCDVADALVACGTDASEPHGDTEGPVTANAAIIVDVVPRNPDGYHADVCRTVCVNEPPEQVRHAHALVLDALDAAVAVLEPGTTAAAVNDAICTAFEKRGVATPRTSPDADAGALHYMAHGVGLAEHEAPICTPDGGDVLESGSVLAIEPAVYDPAWGGVRVEDVFTVTADGARRLTTTGRELVVG